MRGQSWQSRIQKVATTVFMYFIMEPSVQSCPWKELTSFPKTSLPGQAEVHLLQVQKTNSISKPDTLLLLQVVANTAHPATAKQ